MQQPNIKDKPGEARCVAPKLYGRMTFSDNIYHTPHPHKQAVGWSWPTTRKLESNEQQYGPRTIIVGPDWQSIDLGWLDIAKGGPGVGHIVIVNEESRFAQTYPTPEEKALSESKILEVGVLYPPYSPDCVQSFAIIRPLEAHHFTPGGVIRIRCAAGLSVQVTIILYPK
jgi:hypothetical protein